MSQALITSEGELMIRGSNEYSQLSLSDADISDSLKFFPEFMKIDFFTDFVVKDVAISGCAIHVLCQSKNSGLTKVFGWGSNIYGQLGLSDNKIVQRHPIEIKFDTEV